MLVDVEVAPLDASAARRRRVRPRGRRRHRRPARRDARRGSRRRGPRSARVLRPGGRVDGDRRGCRAAGSARCSRRAPSGRLRRRSRRFEADGFKSVRTLAEREGLRFVEGIKPRGRSAGRQLAIGEMVHWRRPDSSRHSPAPSCPSRLLTRSPTRTSDAALRRSESSRRSSTPARPTRGRQISDATSSGSPGPPERMRFLRALEERGVLRLVHARPRRCRFVTVTPGLTRVHADAERRHLERRAARQLIDAGLADAVREHPGKRSQAVHARHVDDRALARLQVRRSRAHQPERRARGSRPSSRPTPRRSSCSSVPLAMTPAAFTSTSIAAERVERGGDDSIAARRAAVTSAAQDAARPPAARIAAGHVVERRLRRGRPARPTPPSRANDVGRGPADAARRAGDND